MRSPMWIRKLVRDGRHAQDAPAGLLQFDAREIRRLLPHRPADDVLHRLRRLAEQHFERHVDRPVTSRRILDDQRAGVVEPPDDGIGQRSRAHTPSNQARSSDRSRARSVPGPRCTRFPAATCRHRARDIADLHARTAMTVIHDFGHRVRQTARSDVVDQQDRVGTTVAGRAGLQASMTCCARRCISGLPRWTEAKSRSAVLTPLPIEDAAPPPRPISIAGPPSTISSAPAARRP